MSNEERSLGEPTSEGRYGDFEGQELAIADTSVQPTPENFDMDAWLQGVRPTRRSVKLYPKAHLIARMEELAVEIQDAPEDANVDDKIDEFDALKAQFNEGVWFTVEKRTQEWVEKFRKDVRKRLNLKPDKEEDLAVVVSYQLVEQIIEPAGITFNQLRALRAANEGEFNKLVAAMTLCNEQLAEKASVLDADFSARRSATSRD